MNCLKTIAKVSPLLKISVQTLDIILERKDAVYYGGEIIAGHCKVLLIESLDVDKIKIKFYGQAKTYLENNKSRNAIEHERLFQQFFWPKDLFIPTSLQPGLHEIPFNFMVPINIPSTFEYKESRIKYKIEAIFGLTRKHVQVIIMTDPNISISKLLLPICKIKQKHIGLLGGRSVSLRCELPRTGFTIGQFIPVTCTIVNGSDKSMQLKATIRQQIILMALAEKKASFRKIHSLDGPEIRPNCQCKHVFNVTIPERLPIVFDTCKLIHVNYILDVYLSIPIARDLHCRMIIVFTNQWLDVKSIDDVFKTNTSIKNTIYGPSTMFPLHEDSLEDIGKDYDQDHLIN